MADPERGTQPNVAQYLASWQDEIESAALCRVLAEVEPQAQLVEVYRRLAATEEEHADFWEEKLRAAGKPLPPRRIGWRTRTLIWLARRFGPGFVVPTLALNEQGDSHFYSRTPETKGTPLAAQEQSHQRLLQSIAGAAPRGVEGSVLARLEGRHRTIGGTSSTAMSGTLCWTRCNRVRRASGPI